MSRTFHDKCRDCKAKAEFLCLLEHDGYSSTEQCYLCSECLEKQKKILIEAFTPAELDDK